MWLCEGLGKRPGMVPQGEEHDHDPGHTHACIPTQHVHTHPYRNPTLQLPLKKFCQLNFKFN